MLPSLSTACTDQLDVPGAQSRTRCSHFGGICGDGGCSRFSFCGFEVLVLALGFLGVAGVSGL